MRRAPILLISALILAPISVSAEEAAPAPAVEPAAAPAEAKPELPAEVKRIEDTAIGFRKLAAGRRKAAETEKDPVLKDKLLKAADKLDETAAATEKKALEELLLLKSAEVIESREKERQAKLAFYEAEKALEEARTEVAKPQDSALSRSSLGERFLEQMDVFKDKEAELKEASREREDAENKARSAAA